MNDHLFKGGRYLRFGYTRNTAQYDIFRFSEVNDLKLANPNLKTMLSIGGWEMGSKPFVQLVSSETNMTKFAANTITVSKDLALQPLLTMLSFYKLLQSKQLYITNEMMWEWCIVVC